LWSVFETKFTHDHGRWEGTAASIEVRFTCDRPGSPGRVRSARQPSPHRRAECALPAKQTHGLTVRPDRSALDRGNSSRQRRYAHFDRICRTDGQAMSCLAGRAHSARRWGLGWRQSALCPVSPARSHGEAHFDRCGGTFPPTMIMSEFRLENRHKWPHDHEIRPPTKIGSVVYAFR